MPIYEFYCRACHTVFSFLSSVVDTRSRPNCPKCTARRLERKPSTFATPRPSVADDEPPVQLDEARLESALESMAGEVEALGDDAEDPRVVASLLRRMGDASGLAPGPQLEEMLSRLESGEDPDDLESALDGLDAEDPGELFQARRPLARRRPPRVDDTLYFL
ncbi:MAG: zinc ribbon domain-containing protein [Thermoanaerobaculia bacterium]|nr:zinc ribbon domain-containing protein [Thermoanaerobaculia bacterium]